jgi:type II restriction enzyme
VSGWVRLVTLAHWPEPQPLEGLFIVAPDSRQKEVAAQMSLPIATSPAAPPVFYLPYSILYEKLEVFAQSRTAIDMLKAASCDIRSMT